MARINLQQKIANSKIAIKHSILVLFMLVFIFALGCKTKKSDEKVSPSSSVIAIKVPIPEDGHILLLSEIVGGIEYLRLQEEPNHLIGNIDKIVPYGGRLYILDKDAHRALFAYKSDGSFIFQIDKQGQGPGEYSRPDDFIIDDSHHRIIILDSNQRKLLFFDLDGNYQKEEGLSFVACSLTMLDANSLAFYLNYIPYQHFDAYHNILIAQDGVIRHGFFRFTPSPNQFRFTPQTVFSQNSSTCYIIPTFSDTVFEITSSQVISKYYIDFGGARLPKSFFTDHQDETVDFLRHEINNFSHLIQNFFETSEYLSFNFSYQHRSHFVVYDKSSFTLKAGALIGNDIDGGPFSYPIASLGDRLVSVLEPTDIVDMHRRTSSRASPQLTMLANTLTELSNPVIALYRVKRF